MSSSNSPCFQVDHLSSLPNELLDVIFDYAHPVDYPSYGPLSKRLLPFYVVARYRRIFTPDSTTFAGLVRKVNSDPQLGDLVQVLHVDSMRPVPSGHSDDATVATFFGHLPFVVEINIGPDAAERFSRLAVSPYCLTFPSVAHLECASTPIDSHPLRLFNSFSGLRTLTVTGFETNDHTTSIFPSRPLPRLYKLSVSGQDADSPSIVDFCASCPNLNQLFLSADWHPQYQEMLPSLPDRLEVLSLMYNRGYASTVSQSACDAALSRFTELRHLTLGNELFSANLPTNLSTLVKLEPSKLAEEGSN
ncbi:hypothetical protein JCM11491_006101 [Sporobolomyces phaffii]